MHHSFNFKDILAASGRAAWQIEDVLPEGARLDFSRRFLPEALARTGAAMLDQEEAKVLNQIRGHEYLAVFGLVEEFILPFVLDHARPQLGGTSDRTTATGDSEIPAEESGTGLRSTRIANGYGDDHRVRALLQFAGEEAKHIHLFKRFHRLFTDSFGTECAMIGPSEAVAAEVLRHDSLAVALAILHIEWMTQSHYVDSVRDDGDLDPLFKSLLKHHWIEEAQHAKLDTLMVEALADGRDEAGIQSAIDEYLEIGTFLDKGLEAQAGFNLDAFERATGRRLSESEREALAAQQHQALRWTYLGSGMTHPKFVATLAAMSPAARDRIAEIALAFC